MITKFISIYTARLIFGFVLEIALLIFFGAGYFLLKDYDYDTSVYSGVVCILVFIALINTGIHLYIMLT